MGVLGLFLIMFLLCVSVGIVGTYVQWLRQRDWHHLQQGKQKSGY
jgi:hypothetical protein